MHAVARLCTTPTRSTTSRSRGSRWASEGSRRVLAAGANDLGGTLMDENISRAAGAIHGQRMDVEALRALVAPLGRPLVQRTTLYQTA